VGVDVDEAADQLYALEPGEFIAARDALVAQARDSGDRELAAAITALHKPTAVAWLANQLARERKDQLADFLALGPPLREASETLSGPALRDLSRQRQQLVAALVQEARRVVAGRPGPRISEEVARALEATLHAALADPDAAAAVESGRLSGGLSHSGFGAAPATGSAPAKSAPPSPAPGASKKASAADRRAAQRAKIEAELAQAWAEAREAAEARDEAVASAEQAARSYDHAKKLVGALQEELRGVQERLSAAERSRDSSRDERNRTAAAGEAAGRAAERARKLVADAQGRLEAHAR
jgi:hypothetical protein